MHIITSICIQISPLLKSVKLLIIILFNRQVMILSLLFDTRLQTMRKDSRVLDKMLGNYYKREGQVMEVNRDASTIKIIKNCQMSLL